MSFQDVHLAILKSIRDGSLSNEAGVTGRRTVDRWKTPDSIRQSHLYFTGLVRALRPRKVLVIGKAPSEFVDELLRVLAASSTLVATLGVGDGAHAWKADPRLRVIPGDHLDQRNFRKIDLRDVNLIFLDSEASIRQIYSEWALYRQFFAAPALVLMASIHLNPEMDKFWSELPYPRLDLGRELHPGGMGLVEVPGGSDRVVEDFFRYRLALYKFPVPGHESKVDGYATHLPVLAACVARTSGDVLELGCGDYSTPMLHLLCKGRKLVSLDQDPAWLARFQDLKNASHEIDLVSDWDRCGLIDGDWDVAFVDHAPPARRAIELRRLRNKARFIVVHDVEDPTYMLEAALSDFTYRYDYTRVNPWSTVVSMVEEFRP